MRCVCCSVVLLFCYVHSVTFYRASWEAVLFFICIFFCVPFLHSYSYESNGVFTGSYQKSSIENDEIC